jgi:hypothetical protein
MSRKQRNTEDLTGSKIGKLTVVKLRMRDPIELQNYPKSWRNRRLWECLCDCGKAVVLPTHHFSMMKHNSCGCVTGRNIKISNNSFNRYQKTSVKSLYNAAKHSAKNREIILDLDLLVFEKLIIEKCHYCLVESSKKFNVYKTRNKLRKGMTKEAIDAATINVNCIDRIDSNKGYTEENILPCCITCNYAKHIKTYNEYINWIKNITRRWREKRLSSLKERSLQASAK